MILDQVEGAGLAHFLSSSAKFLNPFSYYKKISQFKQNTHPSLTISKQLLPDSAKLYAKLAHQSYQPIPQSVDDYEFDPSKSSKSMSVFRKTKTSSSIDSVPENIISFKGTKHWDDMLPDWNIFTGYKDHTTEKLLEKTKQLMQQNPNESFKLTGHSLGGTRAAYIGQVLGLESHSFNPGYNNLSDDVLDLNNPKAHHYFVKGDPISNTMLTEKLPNVTVLENQSLNPVTNHQLSNFL